MAHIEFLDETMRDGQQSLWGMRMQAGMALPVTPVIDRTGYRVINVRMPDQVLPRESLGRHGFTGRFHAAHTHPLRYALERLGDLRRHTRRVDGCMDAAIERTRCAQLLDLRRAVQY